MPTTNAFSSTVPDLTAIELSSGSILLLGLKILLILGGIAYIIYAVIIARQTKVMNNTITTKFGPVIQIAAWINLLVAIIFTIGVLLLS